MFSNMYSGAHRNYGRGSGLRVSIQAAIAIDSICCGSEIEVEVTAQSIVLCGAATAAAAVRAKELANAIAGNWPAPAEWGCDASETWSRRFGENRRQTASRSCFAAIGRRPRLTEAFQPWSVSQDISYAGANVPQCHRLIELYVKGCRLQDCRALELLSYPPAALVAPLCGNPGRPDVKCRMDARKSALVRHVIRFQLRPVGRQAGHRYRSARTPLWRRAQPPAWAG